MTLLDDAKTALRIVNSAFDGEIQDLINAAKSDLKLSGVLDTKITDDDALIKRAVITYCKANFGFDEDSMRYRLSYESLRNALALSSDYGVHPALQG